MPKKGLPQSEKEDPQEKLTNDGMTREEVAIILGIHKEKVRRIEQMALRKLKSRLSWVYKKEDLL
jgi:DNA-directed RNA polymerase sigma subunit (sigma70/sigma32)